jgi:hypothetical protein
MNKKEAEELTNDILIADALLRIKTLENILIAKGIFSAEEFQEEMNVVIKVIAKSILQKAQVPGDLDELINNLQEFSPKKVSQN